MVVKRVPSHQEKSAGQTSAPAASPSRLSILNGSNADSLNNLIHERTRLAIVSTLAVHSSLSFSELKSLLQLSDGNLSVQTRKLEEAGYLSCMKRFSGRTPRTDYSLTATGKEALQRYVAHMEAIIKAVKFDSPD